MSRIFAGAVGLDPSARNSYLHDACRQDSVLRAAVDSLLAAHDAAGQFGAAPGLAPAAAPRLTPGSQIGPFRVEGLLGAGGMGEVYRAHDTKLQRAVALKVLPDSFARDSDRRARFQEEALALAALNHPHIGAIYGLEDDGEVAALVLELIDGPTLAERLAAGPLPLDDALRIGRQLADGLEAAHERGIVHRDLKPANIKVTPDGNTKILDFGLAKADAVMSSTPATSPASRNATAIGAVMGTAGYMSPEQARGQPVDKRTDIWAFGCVLFEMCAGRPPFAGANVSETLAAVLERQPDWRLLPANIPATVVRLLRRCLVSDQKLRLRDIGEARIALSQDSQPEPPDPRRRIKRLVVGVAIGGALAAGAALGVIIGRSPVPSPQHEFEVPPPAGRIFTTHVGQTFFALSPDGVRMAFLAQTDVGRPGSARPSIWVRDLADIEPRELQGTDGASTLFWSPDGRKLGFVANNEVRSIDLSSGAALKLADITSGTFRHGTWGTQDVILLGQGRGSEILRLPATGGQAEVLLSPDRANREARVQWPWFLPDGDRFLYTVRLADGDGELRLGRLDGTSRTIMPVSSNAQFVLPDIVVFSRDGGLLGQRIDLDSGKPIGGPVPIAPRVEYFPTTSRAMFSTSSNGVVAYHKGGELEQLAWADRTTGRETGTLGSPADYYDTSGQLSPNDDRLLVALRRPGAVDHDIWLLDLLRRHEVQITRGPGNELAPIWMHDGRGILFSAESGGHVSRLFYKNLVNGVEEPLLPGGAQQHPKGMFPGDRAVAYVQASTADGFGMFVLPMSPRGSPAVLRPSELMSAWDMRLSSNGQAVVFLGTLRDSGREDLYIAPVSATGQQKLVAQNVAGWPRWNRDGREMYFVDGDDWIKGVAVGPAPQFAPGTVRPLFKVKRRTALVDVARDGRFLLLVPQVEMATSPVVVSTAALRSLRP